MQAESFKAPKTDGVYVGEATWKAPSNIALVKYWGKRDGQIPANPSVSFTLEKCATTTTMGFAKKQGTSDTFSFDFLFESRPKDAFRPKIQTFFERILPYCPYIQQHHFTIDSANSFPHSSGIASSASGMAALALNIMSLEKALIPEITDDHFYQKASFLARLGSGSACRSVRGNLVTWGATAHIGGSSDLFGIPYPFPVHEVFQTYQDTVLLVHKGQKAVSSTVGHGLMHGHPYAESRFAQAHHNLDALQSIFASGDLTAFIALVESEALTLHAMMMASSPYFILMQPQTLEIINRIWAFRKETGIPACFTLDAGANVHLLYPEANRSSVIQFIQDELVAYCENGQYICDNVGNGAQRI
ncbi:diphosphomevalonate/mevalonate 3,5-bisphosphate decarboxylase family protein [Sediminicola luteus]|uniref:Diphosphomevalonate decarboxylase n=1 Tax=Sediminicola luteus TaxID=319238 RepID=A0A2A4GD90_9FLAO|nr:diphosphomevalonate decarboxylase [Sediminicola luteus]PCE65944.1 diphosphomevalonate decarboxylase [Sediminicola luteus]